MKGGANAILLISFPNMVDTASFPARWNDKHAVCPTAGAHQYPRRLWTAALADELVVDGTDYGQAGIRHSIRQTAPERGPSRCPRERDRVQLGPSGRQASCALDDIRCRS